MLTAVRTLKRCPKLAAVSRLAAEGGNGSDDVCTVEEATTQAATSLDPSSQPPVGELGSRPGSL